MEGHENRNQYARGLCRSCYSAARNLVRSGETTWEKLIECGVAKDKGYGSIEDRMMRMVAGKARIQKYQLGSVAVWGMTDVKIIGYNPQKGYELELASDGTWLADEVKEGEIKQKAA